MLTQRPEETKNYIYQLRIKLKHKLENKTKARCQVGNKALKNKTNKYVERKGEIDMQS